MLKWRIRRKVGTNIAMVAFCVVVLGCRSLSTEPKPDDLTKARMKALAILFSQYVAANHKHLPTDEAQLKRFISQKGARDLAGRQLASVDELFVSARDGEPLVIKYGQKSSPAEALAPDSIVAYEKTGVHGQRLVALPTGGVAELDQNEFAEVLASQRANGPTSSSPTNSTR